MRKLILFLAVFSSSASVFGQGQISFVNSYGTRISTNGFGYNFGPISGPPGSFYFGLFIAPTSVAAWSGPFDASWTFTGVYATNTTRPGRLSGGTVTITTPTTQPGDLDSFIVLGWSSDAGHDWDQVERSLAGMSGWGPLFFGVSAVATPVQLGGASFPVSGLFGNVPGTIAGFGLQGQPVPEPSSVALLGLGAALLIARAEARLGRSPAAAIPSPRALIPLVSVHRRR